MFLEGYQAPSDLDASEITIADGANQMADAASATATPMTPPDFKTGQLIVLGVPDMSTARGTQAIVGKRTVGEMVTVTFGTDSGLMTPSNGGMYTPKVWTSKASKHIELTQFEIGSTTPDISRVTLGNGVAGAATSMNIRFVTDENLTSTDTITVTLPDFTLPDFSPPDAYKINGRNVSVGNPDPGQRYGRHPDDRGRHSRRQAGGGHHLGGRWHHEPGDPG